MIKKKNLIGVDLGGTWVRVVLSDEKGNDIVSDQSARIFKKASA